MATKEIQKIKGINHPQVTVTTPFNQEILVDEGMVDLLQAMWDYGFVTFYSCQGDEEGVVYGPHDESDGLGYVYGSDMNGLLNGLLMVISIMSASGAIEDKKQAAVARQIRWAEIGVSRYDLDEGQYEALLTPARFRSKWRIELNPDDVYGRGATFVLRFPVKDLKPFTGLMRRITYA